MTKRSIRDIAATASDFVNFAREVQTTDTVQIDEVVRQSFSDLADNISDTLRVTAKSRQDANIGTLNMHESWQNAQAPKLVELCQQAETLLKENAGALKDVVANERMPEVHRIRAVKLVGALENIQLQENTTRDRDHGAQWQDPLYGVAIEDSM